MTNLVYMHHNKRPFTRLSEQWPHYANLDSAKLFIMAATSWERQGWEVVRVDTGEVKHGFHFIGALARHHLPVEYWNVWKIYEQLAPCWVTHTDVLNLSFKAASPPKLNDGHAMTCTPEPYPPIWVAAIYVTRGWVEKLCELITALDLGVLPHPRAHGYVNFADEYLIEHYMQAETFRHPVGMDWVHWGTDTTNARMFHIAGEMTPRIYREWKVANVDV